MVRRERPLLRRVGLDVDGNRRCTIRATIWASDRLGQIIDQHHAMCDEIDHLRAESAAFRDLAGCCSDMRCDLARH